MRLNAVYYDLVKWKNILSSKCNLFSDINTSYVPIGYLVKKVGIKACLDFYRDISEQALEKKSMLIFDAVIYNEDRHFRVMTDNLTGEIKSAASIFDNGVSLFNYAMTEDFMNLSEYAKTRANPYGVSYETVCSEIIGARTAHRMA